MQSDASSLEVEAAVQQYAGINRPEATMYAVNVIKVRVVGWCCQLAACHSLFVCAAHRRHRHLPAAHHTLYTGAHCCAHARGRSCHW